MTTIYLIDGSGYIFRAFYAIRHLSRSDGLPTNALYGFTQMLWKFLRDVQPTHAAVLFDAKEATFREVRYPAYKANRKAPPEALVPQFPLFPRATDALGLPQLTMPGFEADDLIGTLAQRYAAQGHDVVILTGDKDLMQLVDARISLWDTLKERRICAPEVRERFGVNPDQVVDLLALAGDSSDNIKGVPGIGEKTASKLINQYGSLAGVLAAADNIPGKTGEQLRAHGADAELAQWLARIDCTMDITLELPQLAVPPIDRSRVQAWCREMEFFRMMADLGPVHTPASIADVATASVSADVTKPAYQCVTTREALVDVVAAIRTEGQCAIDTETIGLHPQSAQLVGISLAWQSGQAVYLPLRHHYLGVPDQLPIDVVCAILGPLLADPAVPKDCHHANFDLPILSRHGLPVAGLRYDTLLLAYLLDPAAPHDLDTLARTVLGHRMTTYAEVVGTGRGALANFSEVPVDVATAYAAEDADITAQLVQRLLPQVEQAGFLPHYQQFERPLIDLLITMEAAGIAVDVDLLRGCAVTLRQQLQALEAVIYDLAGERFNIASPKQLGQILFEKLQLPGGKRTKTGFSTNADVLESLAAQHPVPAKILEYRQLAKLLSTYVEALPAMVDAATGRVHTIYHQHGTATGRLSSSDPNLQNIPVRTAEGRRIREAFVAPAGSLLLSVDYSQIELRVLAHMSGEAALIAAFRDERDIHAQTAAALFEVSPDAVTDAQRAVGKTVNFSVIYGQSAYGLAGLLQIPARDAATYIERYLAQYPAVAAYRARTLETARSTGVVTTLYGHRRKVPDLASGNGNLRGNAERAAFNAVIQGTAAEIMKLAMLEVGRQFRAHQSPARLIMQVHDELVCEVEAAAIADVTRIVCHAMENVQPPSGTFAVPLSVSTATGTNWAECQ